MKGRCFQCKDHSRYIPIAFECDGFPDCSDLSDEKSCSHSIHGAFIGFSVLGSMGAFVALLCIVFIVYARRTTVIMFLSFGILSKISSLASPTYSITSLVGIMILYVSPLPFTFRPTHQICSVNLWLPNLGLTILYSYPSPFHHS
jgi:hypothetical protein